MSAVCWAAPIPRCPRHAYLRYDRRLRLWACSGWDGEGCGYTLDAAAPEWTYLGEADTADTVTTTGGYL